MGGGAARSTGMAEEGQPAVKSERQEAVAAAVAPTTETAAAAPADDDNLLARERRKWAAAEAARVADAEGLSHDQEGQREGQRFTEKPENVPALAISSSIWADS